MSEIEKMRLDCYMVTPNMVKDENSESRYATIKERLDAAELIYKFVTKQ